ncbi:MAG: large conductance mechanosensitive channel protein MscL [Bacteroidota bacterium]
MVGKTSTTHSIKIINEFREFAVKGNMIDLAVGIMIGTAFNNTVSALVKYILTPPIGYFTNGVDASNLKVELIPAITAADGSIVKEPLILEYGLFIETFMDFLIIALVMFGVVRLMNNLKRKAEDKEDVTVPTPKDIELLSDIKTELKSLNTVLSANLSQEGK